MDDVSRKREALIALYPGFRWKNKVKNWPESQVIAVYLRLKAQGKVS